jgi:hypothetical protein
MTPASPPLEAALQAALPVSLQVLQEIGMSQSGIRAAASGADIAFLLSPSSARRAGLGQARWQALLAALPSSADKLWRRRAGEVAEADLDDYVTLQWMRWNGGSLELTDLGRNLVQLVDARSGE